jgi:DNA-binding beta-propeller fold protein YncE
MTAMLASRVARRHGCGKSHRTLTWLRRSGGKLVGLPVTVLGTRGRVRNAAVLASALVALLLAGCGSNHRSVSTRSNTLTLTTKPPPPAGDLSGLVSGHVNLYSADVPGDLSPVVRHDPALVYVPNSMSNTVDVISQRTLKIVEQFPVGGLPQHVTPSYDLRTLYVDNDLGNSLTPIDPRTGRPGRPIRVADPYNLYFTPDGRFAIVVAERLERLDFRDPRTMRLVHSLSVPECRGVDHMDFSADGRYAFASCEFAGRMVEIDLDAQRVIRTLVLDRGLASPQDVKVSPDGRTVYVADQLNGGIWEIDPSSFRVTGFLKTGAGAHGLYPSRNATVMYVSNRQSGSISVVSFHTRRVIHRWQLPLPASPDMGGVSADGRTLWLSGRYNAVVYAIDTRSGHLRAAIPVGDGPHGLCVWPQPGRYSLGHTGILR